MPKVLKSFITKKNPLVIITKSVLILRDIELINELNKVAQVSILISVSTLDETKRKLIEPNSAPTIERMKMLREFRKIGCQTGVLFMPVIPHISDDDDNLNEIYRLTKEYDLGSIMAWPLHLRGNTKEVFYKFLTKHFPELLPKYRLLYKKGNVSKEYWSNLRSKLYDLQCKYDLFSTYKPTSPSPTKQLTLFDKYD